MKITNIPQEKETKFGELNPGSAFNSFEDLKIRYHSKSCLEVQNPKKSPLDKDFLNHILVI